MHAEARVHGAAAGWPARLELVFRAGSRRTIVARREHAGPFCIQQPFYPPDGVCHVYLLHPPGGLAGGDMLDLAARLDAGARVLMTTPASTKFYRSDGRESRQTQVLRVGAGAALEWLPQDTLLFGGSRASIRTEVRLDAGAAFIGFETLGLGRPLSGDDYATGTLLQRTEIHVGDEPCLLERLEWQAGDALLRAAFGLGGYRAWGALYAYPADRDALTALRAHAVPPANALGRAASPADALAAATLVDRLLVLRCIAARPRTVQAVLQRGWETLRPAVVGRAPVPPRIWMT